MNYRLTIKVEGEYIHAQVTGEESLENSWSYWREIAAACKENNIKNVLVEDYLEGEISTIDLYTFAKGLTDKTGLPVGTRIAAVSLPEKLPSQQFAETVSVNWAGVDGKAFTDIDEARNWLLSET
jgi:hypothetical protein